jgi:protease-4
MNHRVFRFLTAVLGLGLVLGLAPAGCTLMEVDLGPKYAPLEEKTVLGEGGDKVLMVDLSGVLVSGAQKPSGYPFAHAEDRLSLLAEELAKAEKDDKVKALILRIDSPGGTVTASDVIHHQIMAFKEKKKVRVVASLQGMAASGGYYAALAADRIVALPATMTGSVGVITVKLNLAGLMGKYGVSTEVVKSGNLKDIWSPFRPASDEERRIMQGMIDDMFHRFRDLLVKGRPNLKPDQLQRILTAQVFTGVQAKEIGLVDQVGYLEDAFDQAKQLAGLNEAQLVVYHRPGAYRPNVYSMGPEPAASPDLLALHYLSGSPQLMYLWLPAGP